MYCSSRRWGSRACATGAKTVAQAATSARNAEPWVIRSRQVLEALNHHFALASLNRRAFTKDIMIHSHRLNSGDRHARREYVFGNHRRVFCVASNRTERDAAGLPPELMRYPPDRQVETGNVGCNVIRLYHVLRIAVGCASPPAGLDIHFPI